MCAFVSYAMMDTPRLITTLGLPRKVELALLKEGLFSVEQLRKIGEEHIRDKVGAFGLRWIKRQLKNAGTELPRPVPLGRKAQNREAEMRRLYLAGESLQMIGDTFDLTRERVRQIVDKTFPPEELEQAKQTHYQNYHAPRVAAKKYLMQIAEGHTQATFTKETGIPRPILITMLPEVNAKILARRIRNAAHSRPS
jgi:hypothetical protein